MQIKELIEKLQTFDQHLQLAILTMEIDDPHVSTEVIMSVESKDEWATNDHELEETFMLIH